MNLLNNAVESIRLGVEDFQQGSDSRLLSSVRNIHAGILLLYKESLRRLSPEGSKDALLKSKIIPKKPDNGGNIIFVGAGKNTVSVRQIKERFKSLSIKTDWKRFNAISKVRNDIEHHYTPVNKEVLQGVIANACIILRDFMVEHLEEVPTKLLDQKTWQAMLRIEKIYHAERKLCDDAIKEFEWHSETLAKGVRLITCSVCNSDLLFPGTDFLYLDTDCLYPEKGLLFPGKESSELNAITIFLLCRACGAKKNHESFVPEAVCMALAHDGDLSYADGGKMPCADCPQCSNKTYVMKERKCAFCDHRAEHTCKKCGKEISSDDLFHEPYCGQCSPRYQ